MEAEQALQVLDQIAARTQLTRADHKKVLEAVETLAGVIREWRAGQADDEADGE